MRKGAILIVALMCSVFLLGTNAKAETREEIDQYIIELANEYELCPELIMAMVETESSYNPKAVNSDGTCFGLMQIQKVSHKKRMKELGVTDLTDAYSNLLVGIDYLYDLFQQYEDTATVLMAYNGGTNGVKAAEKGKVWNYAKHIAERSAELEEEHDKIEHGFG